MFLFKRLLTTLILYLSSSAMIIEPYDDRSMMVPKAVTVLEIVPTNRMANRGDIPATPEDNEVEKVVVAALDTKVVISKPNTGKVTQSNKLFEIEVYAGAVFSKYNLSAELARAAIRIESRTGRRMMSPTGCEGYWQACERTARAYGLKDPYDLAESTDFAARVFNDNRKYLKTYGVPITDIHLYMAYMIGPKHTQTVWKIVNGKSVSNRWINAAYNEIGPNWHKGKGTKTGNASVDFPKYYRYFTKKFNLAKNPDFQFK